MYELEDISKSEFQKTQGRSLRGRPTKYPFDKMGIGQSFFVQGDAAVIQRMRVYASNYSRDGKLFSVSKSGQGCRVFRDE